MVRGKVDLWRELLDWGWAVIRHGLSVVAGVVITALVFVTEHYRGEPLTWVAAERILFASFAIAFFLAWREKHHALNDADENRSVAERALAEKTRELTETSGGLVSMRQELDQERQRNVPNLSLNFDGFLWAGSAALGLTVTITVTLRNIPPGAPSAADSWQFWLEKDGKIDQFPLDRIPTPWMIGQKGADGIVRFISISEDDAIYNSAKNEPLPSGGIKTGYLVAAMREHTIDSVDGGTFWVACRDVCNNIKTASMAIDKRLLSDNIPYYAGTSTKVGVLPTAATPAAEEVKADEEHLRPGEKPLPRRTRETGTT